MKKLIVALITLLAFQPVFSQNKIKIERAEDLPKHYYDLKGNKAIDYINNQDLLLELAGMVENNLKDDLSKYDIQDKATMRDYHASFTIVRLLNNDLKSALSEIQAGRKLTEKESEKYLWNLDTEVFIKTKLNNPALSDEQFKAAFAKNLESELNKIPFPVVQEDIESTTGTLDILTKNLLTGMVEGQLQPIIDKAGKQVPGFIVGNIISMGVTYHFTLPYLEDVYKPVFRAYYDKNHVEVELVDIWKDRDVALENSANLSPVVIGIWDSGIDEAIFPKNNQWVNQAEIPDGKDNDNNGFVDDIHGIAYDLQSNNVPEMLFPIEKVNSNYQQYEKYLKGLLDMQAMIKSKEADDLKKYITSLKPEEVNPFIENLNMYSNFSHGTHVAGIAAKGNPQAKLLVARITYDYKNIPDAPTVELSTRAAHATQNIVQYFKDNHVKVVNMSWGFSQNGFEEALAMNGIGENEEERKALAKKLFSIEKDALYSAMKDAPDILFVVAAGNANNDIDFANNMPSGLNLPNMINVGAVDIEGKETSFTTTGKGVDVYSNGYEVESYIPGGEKRKYSGTSMAAPQVVNLAGKIWAKNPTLSVAGVKNLILKGATPSKDKPEILLINPRQSLAMIE